ncbi:MAG: serine hydrolase [Balneolaceae bacterium]|nr:serine hydrolase [Balneolaceae bacterium]
MTTTIENMRLMPMFPQMTGLRTLLTPIRVLLVTTLALVSCAEEPINRERLESGITTLLERQEGEFAVAFKELEQGGDQLLINGNEMFHAASTMKTPVMIEVFKQAAEGAFQLSDSLLVKNEFRSIVDSSRYRMDIGENSDEELYKYIGRKRPILDLVEVMITTSSNLATNILVEKVGARQVTQTMRSYGADSILVLRGVEDIKAYERGLSNRTTARDLMIIFEKLGRGEAVNRAASERMIEILKRQEYNDMIPAKLPENVDVAHKTGWITGVHHDSGLVMLPDGRRYVLGLLSKNAPDREAVLAMFAEISHLVYRYVTKK